MDAREAGGRKGNQSSQCAISECQSDQAAQNAKGYALEEQLARNASPSGTKGGADSKLLAAAFDPHQQAEMLRQQGGFVPGIRPGMPTEKYFAKMLSRITVVGAFFLASVAVVPSILMALWNINRFPYYGTTLLIAVGVALETMRQIDSQLMMRNYEGFLKR